MPSIKHDLANSPQITDPKSNLTDLYNQYYDILHELINKQAPLKTKQLTPSSKQPWISGNILYHKQRKKQPKRLWRKEKMCLRKSNLRWQINHFNKLTAAAKTTIHNTLPKTAATQKTLV